MSTSEISSPVPGYSQLTLLARGGYSMVYRAQQDSVGREVALKVDTRTLDDERDRRRFIREAQAAGRLSGHPNIVAIYDAGVTEDNHPYFVLELAEGGSLSRKLKKEGRQDPEEVRQIGIAVSDALDAAHTDGVLHRDVKPGNILLNRYDVPQLTDFGLAAVLDARRETSVTIEGLTPAYAPPEVFSLTLPTESGDIYSLAATLYALLQGRPPRWPNTDTSPSPVAIMAMHTQPLPEIEGVNPEFTAVLRRAMSYHAQERYPSAGALKHALEQLPVQERALHAPVPVSGVEPAVQYPVEVAAENSSPRWRFFDKPLVTGVLATLLAVVLGVAGYLWLSAPESSAAPEDVSVSGPCPVAGDLRCPTKPECFVRQDDSALSSVPCKEEHTWETYLSAELPTALQAPSVLRREDAAENAYVATVCSDRSLQSVYGQAGAQARAFRVRALLPTAEEYRSGQKRVRCLAGLREGASTESYFARS